MIETKTKEKKNYLRDLLRLFSGVLPKRTTTNTEIRKKKRKRKTVKKMEKEKTNSRVNENKQ